MARDVFISYSYDDKVIADKVCSALEGAGILCWIAPRDERPGETWASKIVRAIDESRIMVLVLSASSNKSKDCTKEVAIATSDEKLMPVIPLRIDEVSLTGDLKYYLAGMHRLDALPPPIDNHLERLVVDVRDLLNSVSLSEAQLESPKTDAISAKVRDMDLERTQEWMEKAEKLRELDLDSEALTCYDKALASNSENAPALNAKGIILTKLDRHEEALQCFEQSTEADPASLEAWKNKGICLQELGHSHEALECYDRALDIEPLDAGARGLKCSALLDLNDDKAALTCCEAATKIDPTSFSHWFFTGVCLAKLGRHQESLESLDKAIALNPQNADALYHRGDVLAKCGRLKEAIESYDRVLRIDPNHVQAWFNKGVCLASLGRHSEAIDCYTKVRTFDPAHPDLQQQRSASEKELGFATLLDRATMLTRVNRHREAIECYDKVLASDPYNADAWYNRGLSFASLGNAKEAARCFDRSLELASNHAKAGV